MSPAPAPISRWIVPIMGFTQEAARPTGFETLWRKLRSHSAEGLCILTPREWDDDWPGVAAFLDRNAAQHARIDVVAYSWGAGHGAMKLAEALGRLPVPRTVEVALLADPVYRSSLLAFSWRSLLNAIWAPQITVPDNVRRVLWTRQSNNKPAGHDLVRPDGSTRGIEPPLVRALLKHDQMDDDPIFHRLALDALFTEGVAA